MKFLVDTNVLLRSVQKSHPMYNVARKALIAICRGDNTLYLMTQNIAEFWNVCTRPTDVNGMGLSIDATDRYVDQIQKFATILPESTEAFYAWRRLVVAHSVSGVKVHDARLVAAMKAYKIPKIVTFNNADFERFTEIEAVSPSQFSD